MPIVATCSANRKNLVAFLVFIQVFAWNVVFRDLVCPDFALIGIGSVFHALDYFGFEGVPFFEQFVHTLGIRARGVGQTLQIARLAA
jgi:hypothetical protein